jgi:DNA-binding SARP family transcriptional activator
MTQQATYDRRAASVRAQAIGDLRGAQEWQHAAEGLRITLLGFPRVTLDGQLVTFARRGAVALLAYLAVTRQVHSRDRLVALLADDVADEKARRHLSNLLHELSAQIGDYLDVTRQTVALDSTRHYVLDVTVFELALARAQEDGSTLQLQAAVDAYQQDLLAGFTLRNASAFEEWLTLERERLNGLLTQALTFLCDAYTGRGEYASGLACANRQLALNPWDETAYRNAMYLLAQSGHRGAALAQYERCRRRLENDLGIEPEAETTALFEELRTAPRARELGAG